MVFHLLLKLSFHLLSQSSFFDTKTSIQVTELAFSTTEKVKGYFFSPTLQALNQRISTLGLLLIISHMPDICSASSIYTTSLEAAMYAGFFPPFSISMLFTHIHLLGKMGQSQLVFALCLSITL